MEQTGGSTSKDSVDILFFLDRRLTFLRRFYLDTAAPLEARLRQIANDLSTRTSQSGTGTVPPEEPPEEWQHSVKCLELLGQMTVISLTKSLQDYLREVIRDEGGPDHTDKKGSWLDRYSRFLEANTEFSWLPSPVDRARVEQLNLARNDFMHDEDIDADTPYQSEYHFEKYAVSRFTDMLHRAVVAAIDGCEPDFPMPLSVNRQKVFDAIADVGQFCRYIESVRRFL